MNSIHLIDDGTLDTVLKCSECGEVFRFNPGDCSTTLAAYQDHDGLWHHPTIDDRKYLTEQTANMGAYNRYVRECIADAETDHECTGEIP